MIRCRRSDPVFPYALSHLEGFQVPLYGTTLLSNISLLQSPPFFLSLSPSLSLPSPTACIPVPPGGGPAHLHHLCRPRCRHRQLHTRTRCLPLLISPSLSLSALKSLPSVTVHSPPSVASSLQPSGSPTFPPSYLRLLLSRSSIPSLLSVYLSYHSTPRSGCVQPEGPRRGAPRCALYYHLASTVTVTLTSMLRYFTSDVCMVSVILTVITVLAVFMISITNLSQ
jgi:hypothetical protein